MKYYLILLSAITCLFLGCEISKHRQNATTYVSKIKEASYQLSYKDLMLDSSINDEHFRGLNMNLGNVTLAGSKGSIIHYNFVVWNTSPILDSMGSNLHFRDAFVRLRHNLYMSIQNPSQVIKEHFDTISVVYSNTDSTCFLDGMDFWKNGQGILFGDPMHGKHFILKSEFDGNSWDRISNENIPEPIKNEAGFAASGTSVVCIGDGIGYIGWGGDEVRVFKTTDYGSTWNAQSTPMPKHQSGTGIYSMAFKDEKNGVAVGGNWEFPDCDSSKMYTKDGGKTWHLSEGIQGYRSCVTYLKDQTYISTGTNGTDISIDGGKSWRMLNSIGFNAIQFNLSQAKILGIGVGNYGLIKLLELTEK